MMDLRLMETIHDGLTFGLMETIHDGLTFDGDYT